MSAGRLDGTWDGLVVVFAGTSWDGVWFPEKHVVHRLAGHVPVLYVDPPISPLTPRRNPELAASLRQPRLRLIRPGLARLTPLVAPAMHRPGVYAVTERLVRRAARRAVGQLGGWVRAVIVASPGRFFGVCGEHRKVLFATDDFVAGASLMGVPEARARRGQDHHVRHADTVVAISPVLVDKWRSLGIDTVLIPNGCDDVMFAGTDQAPPPSDVDLVPPIAGFIGHLSDRIDIRLLEAVADRGCSLLLVGPRQATFEIDRMAALLGRPNVCWVGAKPFEALPGYMRIIDVGLTPYADTTFNRASFPLKTLEYLAGGRAAVATDLPATRWLDTPLVRIASSPDGFASAVQTELGEARTPELVASRRSFASSHSWSSRAEEFATVLGVGAAATAEPSSEGGAG